MNRLERLALKKKITHSKILEYLQDHGVISDNCWKLDQIANDKKAHKFIIKEYDKLLLWMK